MNLDSILGQLLGSQFNAAKAGDSLAAGALAAHDLDAAQAMEACLCATVHLMLLSRVETDIIKSLDVIDTMLLMAKHDVIESVHTAGHGLVSHLAETQSGLTAEQVLAKVDRVHQTSCVGAMLTGCSQNADGIYPMTHDEVKAAEAKLRSQIDTLAEAMKASKAAQEANATH